MISKQLQQQKLQNNRYFLDKKTIPLTMSGIFMHRFFVSFPLEKDLTIPSGDLYHQLTHVFRARVGDEVILFSAGIDDRVYQITTISKKMLSLSFQRSISNAFCDTKRNLTVLQAYPNKLSMLEMLVQKFTELGVEKVVFWKSEHAQMQDISEAKKSRIQTIGNEALEQCGANKPLLIEYTSQSLQELLETYSDYMHIVAHYEGGELLKIPQESPIALWIGPEGGWSISEKQFFKKNEMNLWKFNNRILRLETAAIVGAGIILS